MKALRDFPYVVLNPDPVFDISSKPKTGQGSRLARREGGPNKKNCSLANFLVKVFNMLPLVSHITYYSVIYIHKYDLSYHGIADSTLIKKT